MENLATGHLLTRLADGDQLAMKEVFNQYYSLVYRNIFRVIGQKEVSEDLSQDVFIRFWDKRGNLQISHNVAGYLSTMAYHEAVGYLRKKSTKMTDHRDLSGDELQVDGNLEIEGRELQTRVEKLIARLPPRCRSVFILSRYDGKSYQEIGEIMNISIKTVENQMGKALNILRSSLKDLICWLLLLLTFFK